MAKKCTTKCDARAKLLFCLIKPIGVFCVFIFLTFSLPSRRWILGCLHTIPDEKLSVIVWTATTKGSLSSTLNFKPARLAERVWCTKVLSSLLIIYFRFSSSQARSSYLLPLRVEQVFILHQSMAQTPSDMWRPTFEIGAAQLRYSVTEIAPPRSFMCVNRSLSQHEFLGGAKVIRCCMNIALKSLLTWLT